MKQSARTHRACTWPVASNASDFRHTLPKPSYLIACQHRYAGFSTFLETAMPRGDKSSYTDKQKRQAEQIEEGYERRGVEKDEAERRAWATVNKETGGGKLSGSGRGKGVDTGPSEKGGKLGGRATASRSADERSASARKGAATRKRNALRA
jgi:plasmid stabilization system protein ParE